MPTDPAVRGGDGEWTGHPPPPPPHPSWSNLFQYGVASWPKYRPLN